MLAEESAQTLGCVLLAAVVARLGEAVGEEKERVARLHPETHAGELLVAENSDGESGSGDECGTATAQKERREVSGVADFDRACFVRLAADERRVVRGESALAEYAAGALDELVQGETDGDERAEHRVELRHQHRGGHALSGNVAEHEVEASVVGCDEVAVVAGDERGGLVVVRDLP